jgi:hypothetical protein
MTLCRRAVLGRLWVAVTALSSPLAFASDRDVATLLRGIDDVPPPDFAASLSPDEQRALLALAVDDDVPCAARARALRLVAAVAADDIASDRAVDVAIARLSDSAVRELRVQAAWAALARAARRAKTIDVAAALLHHRDPALREVGAVALWRDGSKAARAHVEARSATETDADVSVVLRSRLARWRVSSSPPLVGPPAVRSGRR